jgi:glucose uptake protein GlcU
MSMSGLLQLGLSTIIFLLAATMAKQRALAPGLWKLLVTLALYSLGNLIMLRLVREFGMASSFSLSAVIQLVAVNLIALVFFGEKLATIQSVGVALAIVAVVLITLGPQMMSR